MADKHENMPGMTEPPKKSTQKVASEKPGQRRKPAPSDATAQPDKAKPDKAKHEH